MTCTVNYLTRILSIYDPASNSDFGLNTGVTITVRYGSTYLKNGASYSGSNRNNGVLSQSNYPPGNIFYITINDSKG
jgi:hypothetical protein